MIPLLRKIWIKFFYKGRNIGLNNIKAVNELLDETSMKEFHNKSILKKGLRPGGEINLFICIIINYVCTVNVWSVHIKHSVYVCRTKF